MSAHLPYAIGGDLWPGTSKLIEECGELVQVLGKLIALGGVENYTHWDGTDIRERLVEEMGDVRAALHFFGLVNDLNGEALDERTAFKVDLFTRWHAEQAAGAAPSEPQEETP